MRPLLFVRNDPFETFGIASAAVADAGADVRVWEAIDGAPPPALDEYAGVIVFGSAFNIEHADERPFIHEVAAFARSAVEGDVPLLGICFGAQLLAWALGAPVVKAAHREIGFVPLRPEPAAAGDPLLAAFADGDEVFQWHMDTFELPAGATLLAGGDRVAHQAYRVGDTAWGTQFHFEVDATEIELWVEEFGGDEALAAAWGTTGEALRAAVATSITAHAERGRALLGRFVEFARRRDEASEASAAPQALA